MKKNYFIKNIVFSILFILISVNFTYSQATFSDNATAVALATQLQNSGILITNPVVTNGTGQQLGIYSNGVNGAALEIDSGIALTTSTVASAFSTNSSPFNSDSPSGTTFNDLDLIAIDATATNDVVVFEFDFEPLPNYKGVLVEYQFGSDEYPDYVGSVFNDVFGFFISDPTGSDPTVPDGDVNNNNVYDVGETPALNLAIVPGTTNPVSVNTVNAGFKGAAQDGVTYTDLMQSAFYINNGHVVDNDADPNNSGPGNGNPGPFPINVEYNGITKKFTTDINLTVGVVYRMKIAIADVGDSGLDSGVFVSGVGGVPIIVTSDDAGTVTEAGGEAVANVLVNDTVGGTTNPSLSDVDLFQVSSTSGGITLNTVTGAINVAPGTPAGIYTLVYNACKPSPTNCSTSSVIITVLPDNDLDGISDSDDDDDDNDGVLDINEGCSDNGVGAMANDLVLTNNLVVPLTNTQLTYTLINGGTGSNTFVVKQGNAQGPLLNVKNTNGSSINLDYSNPVGNVEFKLADFDAGERATINVYDENNVAYNIEDFVRIGSQIDKISSNIYQTNPVTVNANGNDPVDDHIGSLVFHFPDKVSRIEINIVNPSGTLRFTQVTYCDVDSDNDGVLDYIDSDSDNDGCNDVVESGGIDGDSNGVLDGTGFDANGLVTGHTGGYNGVTGNEIVATQVVVDATALTNQNIEIGASTMFTVTSVTATNTSIYTGSAPNTTPDYTDASATDAIGGINYQWYLGDPTIPTNVLSDGGVYSGTQTATLNISNVTSLDGNEYFLVITHDNNACVNEVNSATLNTFDLCTQGAIVGTVTANDPDADGLNNICDLDDDNDGILDTEEGCAVVNEVANITSSNIQPSQKEINGDYNYSGGTGTYDLDFNFSPVLNSSAEVIVTHSGQSDLGGVYVVLNTSSQTFGGNTYDSEITYTPVTTGSALTEKLIVYGNSGIPASLGLNQGFRSRFSTYTIWYCIRC